jgi:cytochrome c-type biogenesis protein CcmE
MNKYGKFAVLTVVILGTLAWLAMDGVSESMTYYKTIGELEQMGNDAYGKRLRVAGNVQPNSIVREGREVRFVIEQEGRQLKVRYDGSEPLPDTFRDRAEALADGRLGEDGVFQAQKIQAKCASKYEAAPGGQAPVYDSKPDTKDLISQTTPSQP